MFADMFPVPKTVKDKNFSDWLVHPDLLVCQHVLQTLPEVIYAPQFRKSVKVCRTYSKIGIDVLMRMTTRQI